ncbi:hypothetical protein RBB50_008178 [Rhinocladiella similis]
MFLSSDPAIPQPASNHSSFQVQTEDDSKVKEVGISRLEHLQPYSREAAMPSHWLEEHPLGQSDEAIPQYHDNGSPPSMDERLNHHRGSRLTEEQEASAQTTCESHPISRSPSDYSPASVGYSPAMPHHPPSTSEYRITSPIYYPPESPTRSSSSYFNGARSQPEPSMYHPSVPALLKESKSHHPVDVPVSLQHSNVLDRSSHYCETSQHHIGSRAFERPAPNQTTVYDHVGFSAVSLHQRAFYDTRVSKDNHLPVSSTSDVSLPQASPEPHGVECSHLESQAEADQQTRPSDLDSLFDGSSGVDDAINVSEQPTGGIDDSLAVQKGTSASGFLRDIGPPESKVPLKDQDGASLRLDGHHREDSNVIPGLSRIATGGDDPFSLVSQRLVIDTDADSPFQNTADRFRNILAANGIKCDLVPENLTKVLESATAGNLTEGTYPESPQALKETIEHPAPGNCSCHEAGQNCRCASSTCACLGCDCADNPDNTACCTNKGTAPRTEFGSQNVEPSTSRDDISGSNNQVNGGLYPEPVGSNVAQPGQSLGDIHTISGNQNCCLPPSRPDTPRPHMDQSTWRCGTELMSDHVRQSVEPESPVPNWIRESTPAYEDRSNTPSPRSRNDNDVEMQNVPGYSPAPEDIHSNPLKSHEPTTIRPESPGKAAAPPIPDDNATLKQPKRGDWRKSVVQGSKVEKRSVTGSKAKGLPKGRNVTRKPTTSVGKLIEQAKAKKASSTNDQNELDQEASTSKPAGTVAAAVQKIEEELKKQKDGTPVRRSQRANKGVRPLP